MILLVFGSPEDSLILKPISSFIFPFPFIAFYAQYSLSDLFLPPHHCCPGLRLWSVSLMNALLGTGEEQKLGSYSCSSTVCGLGQVVNHMSLGSKPQNGDNDKINLTGFMWEWDQLIHVKGLEQGQAHRKRSFTVGHYHCFCLLFNVNLIHQRLSLQRLIHPKSQAFPLYLLWALDTFPSTFWTVLQGLPTGYLKQHA